MNFPETLHYCLQYVQVCVHKIMFDSVKLYCMLLRNLQWVTFIGTQCVSFKIVKLSVKSLLSKCISPSC